MGISQFIIGAFLLISCLGVILLKKPVHACLSFLLTLMSLAALYVQLSAEFIATMQVLIYAGAILVLFMYVIVLFQDAYLHIEKEDAKASRMLTASAAAAFIFALAYLGYHFLDLPIFGEEPLEDFGSVQGLGHALYVDYFFPFEAVVLLFLTALVGSLYTARKRSFTYEE